MKRKIPNSINISMTETVRILRDNGFSISNANFPALVDSGLLPFVHVIKESRTGRRTYYILRRDLGDWIKSQTVTEQRKEGTV